MPSNRIVMNNGGKDAEWDVPDSKMDELIEWLDIEGDKAKVFTQNDVSDI
jgi:hypothetical protein